MLPSLLWASRVRLEIAANIGKTRRRPRKVLEQKGWIVVDPEVVCGDVESYRDYRLTEGKAKGPQCPQCHWNERCEGPWREYPKGYGWDEFVPFIETDEDFWDRVIEINYKGVLRTVHHCLPAMTERGWGRIDVEFRPLV